MINKLLIKGLMKLEGLKLIILIIKLLRKEKVLAL